MKYSLILPLLFAYSCVTPQTSENDKRLSQLILGEWQVAVDDTDPPATTVFHPDGRFSITADNGQVSCSGTWSVSNGMLYETIATKTPSCSFAPIKTVDIIEHVDVHDLILKAEDGITLHRMRSHRDPSAETLNDSLHPRFNWPATGQVRVKTRVLRNGKHSGQSYILYWKDRSGHLEFSSRDFKVHVWNSQNVENTQDETIRKIESTLAQSQGSFQVTRQGRFHTVMDLDAALAQAAELVPPAMMEKVSKDPRFRQAVLDEVRNVWLEMSGLWSVISIEKGRAVWQSASADVLPSNVKLSQVNVQYLGTCTRSPNCVRLSLDSRKAGPEAFPIMRIMLENSLGKEADRISIATHENITIAIDFDSLKPFEIKKNKVTTMTRDGKSKELIEEQGIFFDWSEAFGKLPRN